MQDGYTGYVDRSEWWWVTLISLTLLVFIFSPFILLALQNPVQSGQQFMGALHDFEDSATDLARMQQGLEGQFLLDFRFTSEANPAALVHPLYALLGQLARFVGQSPFVIYHIMRVFVGLFMYLTIYHLGASIWVKVRTRRIFFVVASIGAGFGWLFALLTGLNTGDVVPDLMIPQAYPLYAAAANVHYPLAIACLCLLASVLIPVLRPGSNIQAHAQNGGAVAFLAALTLAFVYPDALLPIGLALILSVLIHWALRRKISEYEWQWGLWVLVPTLPILAYDILVLMNNPFVATWIAQRDRYIPAPQMLLISFGLPLLIALPGLWRAFRRFEADGDRFMLLWLLAMVIGLYLPIQLGQYLLVGMMLPIAYFATRSLEDFWFTYVKRRYRSALYLGFIPLLLLSHIFWLYLPAFQIMNGWQKLNAMLLSPDYSVTLVWMNENIEDDALVLASPQVSLWIPSWLGTRVVYGHPTETYQAIEKESQVLAWYQANHITACASLLDQYQVDYVILGPRERSLGESICTQNLVLLASFGEVQVYATEYAALRPES